MSRAMKDHVFGVTLQRTSVNVPWGIRIVGGADLGTPILVTKLTPGSPGEKYLVVGDIIKKIGDYDARDISHHDAQRLFLTAGNAIKLDVMRDPAVRSRPNDIRNPKAASMLPADHNPSTTGNRKVVFPPPNPINGGTDNGRYYGYDGDDGGLQNQRVAADMDMGFRTYVEDEGAQAWPYRTTPLVLPGAKAKHEKELAPTESYLRHHPNPMMRAPPSHYELLPQEVLMKQKVADSVLQRVVGDEAFAGKQVVHKQFNSPIGLYSDQNIVDTIQHQTGISTAGAGLRSPISTKPAGRSMAPRKTVVYDPAKSETFKALQEERFGDQVQEVSTPAQPKVFAPGVHSKKIQHQAPQAHTYNPLSRSTASPSLQHHLPYVNSMGHSDEHIAQSGSFKRLMNMVMGESEY